MWFFYTNLVLSKNKVNLIIIRKCICYCNNYIFYLGRQLPAVRDVFRLYSSMAHGTTIRDLCIRFNPASLHIDERRLVQFGVLEGFIRRINKVCLFLFVSYLFRPKEWFLKIFNSLSIHLILYEINFKSFQI